MATSSEVPVVTDTTAQPTTRRKLRRKGAARKRDAEAQAKKLGAVVGSQVGPAVKPADPYAKLIKATIAQQYGSAEAAFKRQQARVPSAFDSYRAIISGIANRQQAQYGQSIQQQGQLGNQLAAGAQGLIAQTGQAQQQGAAVTGATPSARVSQDAALAAIQRQGNVAALGGLIGNQGAAEATYLGNRQASSGMAQFQAQAAADQAVADLKRDKGAAKVKLRGDLEQAAAANALEMEKIRIAAAGMGVDASNTAADNARADAELQIDARQKRADRRSRERQNTQDNQTSLTAAQLRAQDRGNDKDGLTPAQRRDRRTKTGVAIQSVQKAVSQAQTNAAFTDPKGNHPSDKQVRARMREQKFTADQIALAIAIKNGTPLTKAQKEAAHRLGIHKIPHRWKRGRSKTVDAGPVKVKVPPKLDW